VKKLAHKLPTVDHPTSISTLNRVRPTVMTIDLTYKNILRGVMKLKPDKACGPDKVSPKLLKKAGHSDSIIAFSLHLKSNRNLCLWSVEKSQCFSSIQERWWNGQV
jgi:hypothetical protein